MFNIIKIENNNIKIKTLLNLIANLSAKCSISDNGYA